MMERMDDLEADVRSFAEKKGGLKFELILAESPGKTPKKIFPSPLKNDLSLSQIVDKLQAAEKRRMSQLYKKKDMRSRHQNRILEVQRNKNSFVKKFRSKVMETYDKKMRATRRNREAYLESIQKKNRDLIMRVNEIKDTMLLIREAHFDAFYRKLDNAEQIRQVDFQVLEKHLVKQDKAMELIQTQIGHLRTAFDSFSEHLNAQDLNINRLSAKIEELTTLIRQNLAIQQLSENGSGLHE